MQIPNSYIMHTTNSCIVHATYSCIRRTKQPAYSDTTYSSLCIMQTKDNVKFIISNICNILSKKKYFFLFFVDDVDISPKPSKSVKTCCVLFYFAI